MLTLSGQGAVAANYPTTGGASVTKSEFEIAIFTFSQLRPGSVYDRDELARHAQALIDASVCWRDHFWTDVSAPGNARWHAGRIIVGRSA
jgi:hypothetical protein